MHLGREAALALAQRLGVRRPPLPQRRAGARGSRCCR
jgi:hypothetical protein